MIATAWSPSENPDPHIILREARADARSGKYELALAKHVWFHENAPIYAPELDAVRVSFALADWRWLGEAFPPAMEKLKEVRNAAKSRIIETDGTAAFDDISSFVAINRELGDDAATVEVFCALHDRNARGARKLFMAADSDLIRAKKYALCGKYLESEATRDRIVMTYQRPLSMPDDPRAKELELNHKNKSYINKASTLVALLVVNNCVGEGEKIAGEFKKVDGDDEFQATLAAELEKALQGIVPEPWP